MATIADLIMRQGEIAARGAERSGQIWGNAVSQLGQIGAGAFQQYAAQKEENKQATALNDFVQSGVWLDNPRAAVEGSVKVLGPRGVQFAQALMGASGLKKARSPEEARQAVKMIAQGFPAAPAANKPQFFTQAYTMMQEAGIAPAGEIPAYNPAEHDPYIAQLAGTTGGQGEIIETVGPEGIAVKRRVSEEELAKGVPVYKAPAKPENLTAEEAFIRAQYGDAPTAQQLLEARSRFAAAGREPKNIGPDDTPLVVQAWVDDLASGNKIMSDVPASLRNKVQLAARQAGVTAPTRRPTEKVLGEITDASDLITRTRDLLESPTGVQEWAKAQAIPDWLTQLTGWGAAAKANRSEFFLYMAETLKAIQGSRPSDKDMQWYMENLPRQGASPQENQKKIDNIMNKLTTKYNSRVRSLRAANFALPGVEQVDKEGSFVPSGPDMSGVGGAGTADDPYRF